MLVVISVPTYLYLREKENSKQQALNASFLAAFGSSITVIKYEELKSVPVVVFQTKGDDGKEYTVLAGEFGSAWVILNKWEIKTIAPTPKP